MLEKLLKQFTLNFKSLPSVQCVDIANSQHILKNNNKKTLDVNFPGPGRLHNLNEQ